MKYLVKTFLFTVLVLSFSISVKAQFINKIKNAASRGVEKAVEKKVEEEANKMVQRQLEKQFRSIFGEDGEGTSSPVTIDMSKIMTSMGQDVETADQYDFFGYLVMEMKSTDDKGKEQDPVNLKSYLSKSTEYTGMEMSDPKNPESTMTMIFDITHNASVLLMENDGSKNSFAYNLDINELSESALEDMEDPMEDPELEIKKTGNTKDILGYPCDEYYVKSKDGEGTYWVTEEPIGGYTAFWSANSPFVSEKNQSQYAEYFKDFPQGNFMEMSFVSNDDNTKVEINVTEINDSESKSFSMSEYPNVMTQAAQNQE